MTDRGPRSRARVATAARCLQHLLCTYDAGLGSEKAGSAEYRGDGSGSVRGAAPLTSSVEESEKVRDLRGSQACIGATGRAGKSCPCTCVLPLPAGFPASVDPVGAGNLPIERTPTPTRPVLCTVEPDRRPSLPGSSLLSRSLGRGLFPTGGPREGPRDSNTRGFPVTLGQEPPPSFFLSISRRLCPRHGAARTAGVP